MKEKKKRTYINKIILAVLVIVAIIVLIVTPIISSFLINKSRKESFARSAKGVVESANLFYAQGLADNPSAKDITFTCDNNECITNDVLDANGNSSKLDIDGKVGTGTLTIYEDGKVSLTLTDGTCTATKEKDGKITVNKVNSKVEKKIIITFDANGGQVSTPSKEVTVNGTYGELPVPTYTGYVFNGWYTRVTDGTKIEESTLVTITENQTLYAQWAICNGFDDNNNCITLTNYTTGDALELGGYNWHVIGDTGMQVTLLMDANQLGDNSNMAHCTDDTDASTDCGTVNGYYQYSWDKSLIRTYLNGEFLTNLESKIGNEIVSTSICVDPLTVDGSITYGGYLMSELNASGKTSNCSKQVSDKVRLISDSEYYNMSLYYTSTDSNYPNVENITKAAGAYKSWLYCNSSPCGNSSGDWWGMRSYSDAYGPGIVMSVRMLFDDGSLSCISGDYVGGVRPVITIVK